MKRTATRLNELIAALRQLQHEVDLIKHVLIVKEPGSQLAADAFEGLRRQIVASTAERRSHVAQVVAMAVAVSRATEVADLAPMVREWMAQSGIATVTSSEPHQFHLLFEDLDGETLEGAAAIDVVEPAYLDTVTSTVIRTGRARRAAPSATLPAPDGEPNGGGTAAAAVADHTPPGGDRP